MSRLPEICLTALGEVTPVGLGAAASCAALRAGLSNKQEIGNFAVDGEEFDQQPAVGGRVPLEWLEGKPEPETWPGHERWERPVPPPLESIIETGGERLARLIPPALADLLAHPGWPDQWPTKTGLYLGLDDQEDAEAIAEMVRAGLPGKCVTVKVKLKGRAAGLAALNSAVEDLAMGKVQAAIVGAIDSQIRPDSLERLDMAGQLMSASNNHGIIPGEAAGFVLLETGGAARARGAEALAMVMGLGQALEPTTGTENPNQARGLTESVRAAVQQARLQDGPPLVVCDLNGDRYRAIEWGLTDPRVLRHLGGNVEVWHPADCLGDCGAASGLVDLIWGVEAMKKGYARNDRLLVWGASDNGFRAAAVVAGRERKA
jgi:3-oxoacyl-[acyl-carrier-protein] synthase-1